MDKLKKYQESKALAGANYSTRLTEAKRMMGEAHTEYEKDLAKALAEYREREAEDLTVQSLVLRR